MFERTEAPIVGHERVVLREFIHAYLGSMICIDCNTRPRYVERSYRDAGKSLLPGSEDDIITREVTACR